MLQPYEMKNLINEYVDTNINQAIANSTHNPDEIDNIQIRVKQLKKQIDMAYRYYKKIIKDLK